MSQSKWTWGPHGEIEIKHIEGATDIVVGDDEFGGTTFIHNLSPAELVGPVLEMVDKEIAILRDSRANLMNAIEELHRRHMHLGRTLNNLEIARIEFKALAPLVPWPDDGRAVAIMDYNLYEPEEDND